MGKRKRGGGGGEEWGTCNQPKGLWSLWLGREIRVTLCTLMEAVEYHLGGHQVIHVA